MRRETSSERAAWTALIDGEKPKAVPGNHFALGRLKSGERNKTEAAYEQHLELRKRVGEVLWYRFEGIKLRLADSTFYTPDYFVMLAGGELQVHEVKGFMTDDANVKVKVAAEMYPFEFFIVRKCKGGWNVSRI